MQNLHMYVCVCVYVHTHTFLPILDSFEEILPVWVLFGLPPFLAGTGFRLLLLPRVEGVVRVVWGSGNQPRRQLADQRGRVQLPSV